MSKYYISGGLLCLSSLLLLLYQTLSSLMTTGEFVWKRLTLMDMISEKYINWIDDMSMNSIQAVLQYIISMNLSVTLMSMGVVLFIIGGIVEK